MPQKRKIIGFDLDDVLLDFNGNIHNWHNIQHGTKLSRDDMAVFDLHVTWRITKEEARDRIFDFYETKEHFQIPPIHGAKDAIEKLKEDNKIYIITSRPESHKNSTIEWLNKNFPNTFDGVYFTNQFHGEGVRKMKSEICKELDIEIFVDDSLYNAKDITESGIPVLLFDAPWNQGKIKDPLITRVFSWEEIIQKLTD
jgi:uncharacterized protein